MSNLNQSQKSKAGGRRSSGAARWLIALGIILPVGLLAAVFGLRESKPAGPDASVFTVKKMNLAITVTEGGNIISDNPDKFYCGVEGRDIAILEIVPDGYIVTPEDVANKKVLVQLDASSLTDRLSSQEISFQSTEASYKNAQLNYEIQMKQNESDISTATLKVTFAQMEFEKYLGVDLAKQVLQDPDGQKKVNAIVAKLADDPKSDSDCPLQGGSLQTWRGLCSDIDLAGQSLAQAKSTYDWSIKLGPTDMVTPSGEHGKGYISRTDVESDALAYNRCARDLEQKKLAQKIFVQYDFPKQLAQLMSNYTDAGWELERVKARAEGRLAQAKASMKGQEAQYETQKKLLEKLRQQVKSTQIVATRPGVVVYASSYDINARWRSPIAPGATVNDKQLLIVMPDPNNMAVDVKVHEASVNKIVDAKASAPADNPVRARIVLDAFPDNVLWGTVARVADMPDSQNFMFSPDVKVYDTIVKITDPPSYLKTGMSAKVEIQIANLQDVLAVPIQAVVMLDGKRVCYMPSKGGQPIPKPVKTGQSNDSFIEIKDGLQVGDAVMLRPPEGMENENALKAPADTDAVKAVPAPAADASNAESKSPAGAPGSNESVTAAPSADTGAVPASSENRRGQQQINLASFDIERMLSRLPEDQRAAVKEKWDAAKTDEEKMALIRQFRPSRPRRQGNDDNGNQPGNGASSEGGSGGGRGGSGRGAGSRGGTGDTSETAAQPAPASTPAAGE